MQLRDACFAGRRTVLACLNIRGSLGHLSAYRHELLFKFTCSGSFKRRRELNSIAGRPVVAGRPKIFREYENEHFHRVMEDIPAYLDTVIPSPCRVNVGSLLSTRRDEETGALSEFRELSLHPQGAFFDIENPAYTKLIEDIVRNLNVVPDDDLKNCLVCLCLWPDTPGTTTPNFKLLWNSLDRECSARCPSWTKQRQLTVADCFFHLRLSRITMYNRTMLRTLARSLHELSVHNIVQYLFYSNLQRWMVASTENPFQAQLYKSISELTVEEIGIVCQGFFKCQKKISSRELLHTIVVETVQKLPNVSSPTLCAVVKELRYSSSRSEVLSCEKILKACEPYANHWDVPSSIQLSGLAAHLRVYRPALLDAISHHMSSRIASVRLKDLAKVLYALAFFNHEGGDSRFYAEVVEQLGDPSRADEIELYHHCLVSCVWYLGLRGAFYQDLTAMALDETKINLDKKHKDVTFELAGLHHSVQIECPTYNGPLLSDATLQRCLRSQSSSGRIPDQAMTTLSMQERLTLEVCNGIKERYGKGPRIIQVLRHFHSPDVILGLDVRSKRVSEPSLRTVADGIMAAGVADGRTCAIVVQGPGAFCHSSERLNGLACAKIRQLASLGFHVVQVPYHRVHLFSKPNSDAYIQKILFS